MLCGSFLSLLLERGLISFLSYAEIDLQLTQVEEIILIHLPCFFRNFSEVCSFVSFKKQALFEEWQTRHGHMFQYWSMRIARHWWFYTSWQQRGFLPICVVCVPYSHLDVELFAAFSSLTFTQDTCTVWFIHQHSQPALVIEYLHRDVPWHQCSSSIQAKVSW